jgi:hypothetical protein
MMVKTTTKRRERWFQSFQQRSWKQSGVVVVVVIIISGTHDNFVPSKARRHF